MNTNKLVNEFESYILDAYQGKLRKTRNTLESAQETHVYITAYMLLFADCVNFRGALKNYG